MKILFAKTNMARKPAYRIHTMLVQNGRRLMIRKVANNRAAADHLKQIGRNGALVSQKLPGIALAPCLQQTETFHEYAYLPDPPLTQYIEICLLEQQFAATEAYLRLNYAVFDRIKTKSCDVYETPFRQWFDPDKRYGQAKAEPCCTLTLLDATAANIILGKDGQLSLIDNEWVFPFPSPLRFLQFRSLYYLSSTLRRIIAARAGEAFPCYQVCRDLLIPKIWFAVIPFTQTEIERYLFYESNLQNRVNLIQKEFVAADVLPKKQLVTGRTLPTLETYIAEQIAPVAAELTEIKQSKFYKVWRKYGRIKDTVRQRSD